MRKVTDDHHIYFPSAQCQSDSFLAIKHDVKIDAFEKLESQISQKWRQAILKIKGKIPWMSYVKVFFFLFIFFFVLGLFKEEMVSGEGLAIS